MPSPYSGADNFPASYNVPSDGDTRDAASVNVGLEALGDRTTWLKNRHGLYFPRTVATFDYDDTAWPPTLDWTSSTTSGTFTGVTDGGANPVAVVSVNVPAPSTPDLLLVSATFTVGTDDSSASVASDAQFEWQYKIGSSGFTRVAGTRVSIRDDAAVAVVRNKPVTLTGWLSTTTSGIYTFQVFGASRQNTLAVHVSGSISATLLHYGAT